LGAWALVSLSCLSRQLEVFGLNPGFYGNPAAPVAVGEKSGRRTARWLDHDPEKWIPVFGKDHGQIKRP